MFDALSSTYKDITLTCTARYDSEMIDDDRQTRSLEERLSALKLSHIF